MKSSGARVVSDEAVARPTAAHASPRPSLLAGLVGAGIQESRTPSMHEREADHHGIRCVYKLIDLDRLGLDAGALPELLTAAARLGFDGLNVTHPCKQAAVALMDELSDEAAAVGAVNTVVFEGGRRVGHNTDCTGFAAAFRQDMPDVARDGVVVLGAGGAGAAVAYALLALGCARVAIHDVDAGKAASLASRLAARFGVERAARANALATLLASADGLVNATPVGMAKYPGLPIDAGLVRDRLWVADVVYFPVETALLRLARERGCRTMSGIGMAVFQAVDAFRLFTGIEPDPQRMRHHFDAIGGGREA